MARNPSESARKIEANQSATDNFGALHREYRDRLVESLVAVVRDRDRAEDIASRAFKTAWEKRDTFKGQSRASTWLEAIARNEARQSWRREQPNRFDSLDQEDARQFAAPECVTDGLEKEEELWRLRKALERLPGRHREVLLAHFVDGLSTRKIAERDQVPLGTVLSRIFTAKQLLRHAWDLPLQMTPLEASPKHSPAERSTRESPAPDR